MKARRSTGVIQNLGWQRKYSLAECADFDEFALTFDCSS